MQFSGLSGMVYRRALGNWSVDVPMLRGLGIRPNVEGGQDHGRWRDLRPLHLAQAAWCATGAEEPVAITFKVAPDEGLEVSGRELAATTGASNPPNAGNQSSGIPSAPLLDTIRY